jgi:hypothetical protein
MTTYQLRQLARALMLVAILAPGASFSQPSLDSSADRQRALVERIEREESRNGPYSEALLGPLKALVLLYQEDGDHLSAIATVERARQVARGRGGIPTRSGARRLVQPGRRPSWTRASVQVRGEACWFRDSSLWLGVGGASSE